MTDNLFQDLKRRIEQASSDPQERNRLWWESLPMTYAPWGASDRLPRSREAFMDMERTLLAKSTFLRTQFDFSRLAGLRVLDIGCGSGVLSCLMAKHEAAVVALDLTEAGVTLASTNARAQKVDISVVRADAEASPFASGSIDYILSWGVLHHSRRTENALEEVRRLLRPGGRGLIMVYHRHSLVYLLKGLYWLFAKGYVFQGYNMRSVQDLYTDGYFHRHFTGSEMREALTRAGLRPTRIFAVQQEEKILPLIPRALDTWLKRHYGWLLVAEFEAPPRS